MSRRKKKRSYALLLDKSEQSMSDVEEDIQKEHENLQKLVKREEKKRKLMNSPGKDQMTFEDIKQSHPKSLIVFGNKIYYKKTIIKHIVASLGRKNGPYFPSSDAPNALSLLKIDKPMPTDLICDLTEDVGLPREIFVTENLIVELVQQIQKRENAFSTADDESADALVLRTEIDQLKKTLWQTLIDSGYII